MKNLTKKEEELTNKYVDEILKVYKKNNMPILMISPHFSIVQGRTSDIVATTLYHMLADERVHMFFDDYIKAVNNFKENFNLSELKETLENMFEEEEEE